jgi:hypothetical protein
MSTEIGGSPTAGDPGAEVLGSSFGEIVEKTTSSQAKVL